MIEISDQNFARLLEARNEMGAALQRLTNVSEALAGQGDHAVPNDLRRLTEKDLAEAVSTARKVLAKHGEHQAFVLV
ncbi:hypothetical protein [Ralstonia pseudosolanacearum]|uniref:hypothetical protein n=1 Tax=Ralstonia pseudosolanacearum TaxID=1310165 RepID=UPI003CE969FA